jgi:hypothetical protein
LHTHTAFIHFKNAFNIVHRNQTFGILKDHITYQLIKAVHNSYNVNLIAITVGTEYSECGVINKCVHQNCSFSPLLLMIYLSDLLASEDLLLTAACP